MSQQSASRRVTTDIDSADDDGCTILHVDMDAFFAAVELLQRPDLRGRPMMVAGDSGRSVVLSATYEARAFGVRSAMPTARALARCPGIVVIPPNHASYREASARLMRLLGRLTPLVEQVSVDEAFLDVSGALRRLGRPGRIAQLIRQQVTDELGLTATVGVADTKFVAKLASSLAKPDGLLIVPRRDVTTFLSPLPVSALWGVGPRTAAALHSGGMSTVGDVADSPVTRLARMVGRAAAQSLHELSHGRDARRVTPDTAEVSVGAEQTFEQDVAGDSAIRRSLLKLSGTTARRLRGAGRVGRTVVLKVRFDDFTTVTRSESLSVSVDDDRAIYESAVRSWRRLGSGARPVRLLGIRVENLERAGDVEQQLELASDSDRPGWRDAQRAVDALAARFGSAAPQPATLVERPVGARRDGPAESSAVHRAEPQSESARRISRREGGFQ